MNILFFSYNFMPMADAESYCATRYASALARAGHQVTVVTMDWPMQVSEANYKALVADEINVVRLPFSKRKNTPLKALLWYGHNSQMAVDVSQSVRVVTKLLKLMENPVLITRSLPVMGLMVGLKTRKYAAKWIAHFSDVIPWMGYADTIGHKILKRLEYNIVRKTLIKADKISITCKYACNFFRAEYNSAFDGEKFFSAIHIGDYRLGGPIKPIMESNQKFVLLHTGYIYATRGGSIISEIMRELALQNYHCKFVQIGPVEATLNDMLKDSENIEIHQTCSLEESLAYCSKATAIFIPDMESPKSYSPFLPSKFVYRIMDCQPIVVYAQINSMLHDYAVEYPEAGIFWAEIGNTESLKNAIKAAMEMDYTKIDRSRIRQCFSEETIVRNFEKALAN